MKIINFWGSPSSGKSTAAAGLFYLLKIHGYRTELVHEFAKELVWEERNNVFNDQMFIFSEQNRRLLRLDGKVDFVITDSPLPLTLFYAPKDYLENFSRLCFEQFHNYDNINIMIKRNHKFEMIGRRHNELEAIDIEAKLIDFLQNNNIQPTIFATNPQIHEEVFHYVIGKFSQVK